MYLQFIFKTVSLRKDELSIFNSTSKLFPCEVFEEKAVSYRMNETLPKKEQNDVI